MVTKQTPKYMVASGFVPDTKVQGPGLVWMPAAVVSIAKGDALHDDTNGYVTNATTAFASTFRGVAAAAVDNSGGSSGDLDVPVIPVEANVRYWVPNGSATVAAQTDVGEIVDLEAVNTIDVTDVGVKGYGFKIDKIDVSTTAVGVNTGGYVRGVFVVEGDQA